MIISSNFIQFCTFILSLSQILKLFGNISDSFKLWQYWTFNMTSMDKDKKVYIAVTFFEHCRKVTPIDNLHYYIPFVFISFFCVPI
jgi:hypothetical protein